ncbi:hypothetical protein [Kribbella sindirgiensis]|uniref:Uncharacterized protein n=1 Tax=Kribbella sindirgiensis TaxID=1124744 RepID=A0A4V2M1Y7_9ACTN|nr:hypothetical protein [Kribbella sindirgiensis]TCC19949.1 hypothetical protein E0H50_37600 [Kribbella sindirgiensis]
MLVIDTRSLADMHVIGKQINAIEFDHPFTLTSDGVIGDAAGVYAPESVTNDPDEDVLIDADGWEALTGMTGQYCYHGAVMHTSEFIGAQIAAHLIEMAEDEPQTFVIVTVMDDEPNDADEFEAIGWAILRRTAGE